MTTVTVRGTAYTVTHVSEDKGHLGSKFAGKRVFTLTRGDGAVFTYFGKRPGGNARLLCARCQGNGIIGDNHRYAKCPDCGATNPNSC